MSDATGRFVRVREAFDQIAALEPAQRDAAIAMACGSDCELARELRGLLDAHDRESGHTGDTRARMVDEGLVALTETTGSGDRIGPFLLREVLGRGGMGVVYRAERVDGEVKQQVAVKVMQRLHLDEAGIRRFSQERDIVAQLAHPYIARLFDAGTTRDGAPYYAMELVDGSSIVDWCDSRSADVGARLDIFLKVCEAVRFAHANLVLHRDIKPGNVLVDAAGDPKLIDFGIAKAMGASDATATARQLFTPGNAAPEQLRGQHCGVACDVYQLGTLLYELLTGSTVLRTTDTTPAEIEESILRRVPPRPSDVVAQAGRPAAAQALRGDLDTIVMRALRKEPEQRYASVEQLVDEIRRHQRDEPIAARGGERAYRLRKFVRRQRAAIGATTAILLLVVAVIGLQIVQSRRLVAERDAAEAARTRAQAISGLLTDVFTAADPGQSLDRNASIGSVLDRGRKLVEARMADDPSMRVPLQGVLATVYANTGDLDSARHLVDDGIASLENAGLDSRTRIEFLVRAARVRAIASDIAGAEAAASAAVAIHEQLGDAPSLQWPARRELLGARLVRMERPAWRGEVLGLLRYMEADGAVDPLLLARVRAFVGNQLTWAGATDQSIPMLRASVAVLAASLPDAEPDLLDARYALGLALTRSGQTAEGVELLSAAAHGWASLYGAESPRVARTKIRIAEAQLGAGQLDAAEATGRRALANIEHARPWPHGDYLVAHMTLGEIYRQTSRWAESEHEFAEALRVAEALQLPEGANVVAIRVGLATALHRQGRSDEAFARLQLSRPIADFDDIEHCMWALLDAELLGKQGRRDEALALLERARPSLEALRGGLSSGVYDHYIELRRELETQRTASIAAPAPDPATGR